MTRIDVISFRLACTSAWVLVASLGLNACTSEGPAEVSTPTVRPVVVMPLVERKFNRQTHLTGAVALYRRQDVGFEVSGRVLFVLDVGKELQGPVFDANGQLLRSGDIIAKLDDTRPRLHTQGVRARLNSLRKQLEAKRIEADQVTQANLRAARARLRGAKNEVEAARQEVKATDASLRLANQTLERQKRLMTKGAGRQQDVDDARSIYDRMRARKAQMKAALQGRLSATDAQSALVATAEAAIPLKQAEVESLHALINETRGELERAQEDLKDTTLRAPFTGRVTRVHVTQGAVVTAANPVVTLSLMDPMQVQVQVSADQERRIQTGDRVTIYPKDPMSPTGKKSPMQAMVYEKGAVADANTHTFRIDLMVRNERRRIYQLDPSTKGLPVVQNILPIIRRYHGEEGALFVETHAIYREGDKMFVLRIPDMNLDSGGRMSIVGKNVPEKIPVVLGTDYYRVVSWTMQSLNQHGALREGDLLVLNPKSEHLTGFAYGRSQWVLRPGDLVPVHFISETTPKGFYVPVDAIVKIDERPLVFVAESNRAMMREVSVHESYGGMRRIEGEGIGSGSQVIVSGVHYVADGQPIRIIKR